MKKAIFFTNLMIASTLFGMQDKGFRKDISSFKYSINSIKSGRLLPKENYKTLTNREWISKVIHMRRREEDFNSPQNSDGWTILMCATKYADCKIMQQIFNAKDDKGNKLIDMNAEDKRGNTALSIAMQMDDDEKVKLLLMNGADVGLVKNKVSKKQNMKLKNLYQQVQIAYRDLLNAIARGDVSKVKSLLQNSSVDINAKIRLTRNAVNSEFTILGYAARRGHKGIIDLLLKHPGIDVNIQSNDGRSALMWAAYKGYDSIVDVLLKHPDIDVNIKERNGLFPLILATHKNYIKIIHKLLKHPNIDINARNNSGSTILMYAVHSSNIELVKLLLKNPNIDVNVQDNNKYTVLMAATNNNNKEVIKLLLKHPDIDVNMQDIDGITAFMGAVNKGNKEIIELMLSCPRIDINKQDIEGYTALMIAAHNGHKEIVDLLLKRPNIQVNIQDNNRYTALIGAAHKGYEKIVELLLKHPGVDVNLQNIDGDTALMWAIHNNRKGIVQLLLKCPDIDVNIQENKGCTALMFAIHSRYREIVELLLRHPSIDVNIQENRGCSALMYAVHYGYREIVEMLLKNPNININIQDIDGDTALMWAIHRGAREIVEMLLNHPCVNINVQNICGDTALMWAARKGHKKVMELFLNRPDIDIDAYDKHFSALGIAVFHGHEEIVKMLLDHNADVNRRYLGGLTPLMFAVNCGHVGIVELLLKQPDIDINITNDEGETAIQCAEHRAYGRKIKKLIQSKIKPNGQRIKLFAEKVKPTPTEKINEKFLDAVTRGDIDKMDSLLDEEDADGKSLVNLNARNKNGDTSLIIASEHNNLDAVRLLLSYKADFFRKDIRGNNALIRAAQAGSLDVVEELINRKENIINSTNNSNSTALMVAAENGHIRVVKLLIEKGAKTTIKNEFGKTALDIINTKIDEVKNKKGKTSEYEDLIAIKEFLDEKIERKIRLEDLSIKSNLSNTWKIFADGCEKDLKNWEKDAPNTYNKIQQLIGEIKLNPFRGLGQVERLRGDCEGFSRRINKQDRLVYEIDGEKVILKSCKGHYEKDKNRRSYTKNRCRK